MPPSHIVYITYYTPCIIEVEQHSSETTSSSADSALPKETPGAKKTIISPQFLPSGPLINLTKVAAQHKKNQMTYTSSLVTKHAAMDMMKRKKAMPKVPPTTTDTGTPTTCTQKKKKKATPTTAPPTRQPARPTYSIVRRKEIELTGEIIHVHVDVHCTYF